MTPPVNDSSTQKIMAPTRAASVRVSWHEEPKQNPTPTPKATKQCENSAYTTLAEAQSVAATMKKGNPNYDIRITTEPWIRVTACL